jgi:hypothetical protein
MYSPGLECCAAWVFGDTLWVLQTYGQTGRARGNDGNQKYMSADNVLTAGIMSADQPKILYQKGNTYLSAAFRAQIIFVVHSSKTETLAVWM